MDSFNVTPRVREKIKSWEDTVQRLQQNINARMEDLSQSDPVVRELVGKRDGINVLLRQLKEIIPNETIESQTGLDDATPAP